MIVKRNRRKQTVSFDDRLKTAAREARQAAQTLPQGAEREDLLRKARQAEAARRIYGWLMSRDAKTANVSAGPSGSHTGSDLSEAGSSRSDP